MDSVTPDYHHEMLEKDYLACCGSIQFAKEMALASPFPSLDHAISAARDIWFNKVDVNGWLEAFSAHPQIGGSTSSHHTKSPASAQWSKVEQSTALATATSSSLQELSDWNTCYRQKFGFVFLICASGRSTAEILDELKKRYPNRPIVEFEIAAQEQMKVTELRLAKLFSTKGTVTESGKQFSAVIAEKAEEDRVGIIGGHLAASSEDAAGKVTQFPARTRPPITTHVLDVSRGSPAAGVDVCLQMWKGTQPCPMFGEADIGSWIFQGLSTTDKDGRSGQLMSIVDVLNPGIYRISFNTGKYCPNGFFPFVSIVFEIRESQKLEHFHVPLLLSPFSYSTYRGS
ncbi:Transthyretin domain-containing protein/OHCU_decarbox domain-containing protein [Cephalotus follicularis]|uniref:Transthyretin domain-containing protein/OHCU_decarbox domain-containing protein n=1 Tax=Cephalotus follicularis TaxID=3775 RepID=A0A1Q3DCQ4_CEPFO|nr:Transthyretin domain-containing protein/OHCU_decarbox domain-containing protein [Cephalotus follicularis]